jgi:hypothetical protein
MIMDVNNNYSIEFSDVLARQVPEVKQLPKTFMEIAGYPHYENAVSNILQFFFSPDEEHDFQDLFIYCLLNCINKKTDQPFDFSIDLVKVEREFPGHKKTRIDLLILSGDPEKEEGDAIIIECKVWAQLYNNLDHYWDAVNKKNKVGVILSLNKEYNISHSSFINITFEEFINEIINNLGRYLIYASDKHIVFLKDFIANLSSIKTSATMSDYYKFYYEHQEKINRLAKMRDDITKDIRNVVVNVGNELGYKPNGSAYHYRYWLIEGTSDAYFIFIISDGYGPMDNSKLKIKLEIRRDLLKQKDMFLNDHALQRIATIHSLQMDEAVTNGNYQYLMIKEIDLNADLMINLRDHLIKANSDFIGAINKRVLELIGG